MKYCLTENLKSNLVFFFVFCGLFLGPLRAAADTSGLFCGVKVGTLGVGADVGYSFFSFLKLRGNINYFAVDLDWNEKDKAAVSMDANIKSSTLGALLDFHPFAGSFRLTGGLYRNRLDFKMDQVLEVSVGGSKKRYAAHSDVKFNKVSPYVGIGYGSTNSSGLSFNFDLGLLFLGDPTARYSGGGKSGSEISEEIDKLEHDVKKYAFWPVTMFGLTYRF